MELLIYYTKTLRRSGRESALNDQYKLTSSIVDNAGEWAGDNV